MLEQLFDPPQQTKPILLAGCVPEPLSNYLKALGVLRAIDEQLDPSATGYWQESQYYIQSRVSQERLVQFFLRDYQPSPACSPWNGNSGFWSSKTRDKTNRVVQRILTSAPPRWSVLRSVYEDAAEIVRQTGRNKQPDDKEKVELIQQLQRTITNPQWQQWLAATIVLREQTKGKGARVRIEQKLDCPRLLGTGGNISTSDLGACFALAIEELWDIDTGEPLPLAEERIRASLFAEHYSGILADGGLVQYHPSSDFYLEPQFQKSADYTPAGGGSTASCNPVDMIFLVEGLLCFSGLCVRQLESEENPISEYSLAVTLNTSLNSSSASDEIRGSAVEEVWLPLWSQPLTSSGLREDLFNLGRNRLPGQPVVDTLDFAAIASRWGIDRGIDRFIRYCFLPRKGQGNFAVSLGQYTPTTESLADLVAELRPYRSQMRRFCCGSKSTPHLEALFVQFEQSLFNLTTASGSVLKTLTLIGELEAAISHSGALQYEYLPPPCPTLSEQWTNAALQEENSAETRLALSLVSLRLRQRMVAVLPAESGRWFWNKKAKLHWQPGNLLGSLITLQSRWQVESKPSYFSPPQLRDVAAFLEGVNLSRLESLIRAFALCRGIYYRNAATHSQSFYLPPLYIISAACAWGERTDGTSTVMSSPLPLVRLLALNQPDRASQLALQRLYAAGYRPGFSSLVGNARDTATNQRLAAALAFPLTQKQIDYLISKFL